MTRDQLEAAIWQFMRVFQVSVEDPAGFVDFALRAADAYASGDSDEATALRRDVLYRETAGTR